MTDGMDGNVIIKIEVGPDLSLQTTMVAAAAQQQQNKLTPQNQGNNVKAAEYLEKMSVRENNAGNNVKAAEYLEKMSVRGLDIQRYEHIVDGVTYCLVCAKNNVYKTFKNKYSFQRHAYLLHEGENRKIFPCPICNREFSRPDKMKMHKKDKHGSDGDIENNAGTPPPPSAKRSRTGATKTPRSRSKASTNNNSSSTLMDDEEATKKRLAQIDSIFEDVLNANSNHSQESTDQQQQAEQIDSAQSENQQQLGLFNNIVLPAAAQLQLTLANQSPTTAATLTTLEALQPTLLNNIKQEQDHMNNSNELVALQQAQQLQYAGNVQFIDTMQNYQILTSNSNNNIAQNYHSSKQNTNNLQFSMSPYSFNQVQTQNGTHLVLTAASANPQVIVNGFQGNPAVIKIESSSN